MKYIVLLFALLSLSANVAFAQVPISIENGKFEGVEIDISNISKIDTSKPPYFQFYGIEHEFTAEYRERKMVLTDTTLELLSNSLYLFEGWYTNTRGKEHQAGSVQTKTPDFDFEKNEWYLEGQKIYIQKDLRLLKSWGLKVIPEESYLLLGYTKVDLESPGAQHFPVEVDNFNFRGEIELKGMGQGYFALVAAFSDMYGNKKFTCVISDRFVDTEGKEGLMIFPNPAPHGIFQIHIPESGERIVTIFDVLGIVKKTMLKPSGTEIVIAEELPAGIYFVHVEGFKPIKLLRR